MNELYKVTDTMFPSALHHTVNTCALIIPCLSRSRSRYLPLPPHLQPHATPCHPAHSFSLSLLLSFSVSVSSVRPLHHATIGNALRMWFVNQVSTNPLCLSISTCDGLAIAHHICIAANFMSGRCFPMTLSPFYEVISHAQSSQATNHSESLEKDHALPESQQSRQLNLVRRNIAEIKHSRKHSDQGAPPQGARTPSSAAGTCYARLPRSCHIKRASRWHALRLPSHPSQRTDSLTHDAINPPSSGHMANMGSPLPPLAPPAAHPAASSPHPNRQNMNQLSHLCQNSPTSRCLILNLQKHLATMLKRPMMIRQTDHSRACPAQ